MNGEHGGTCPYCDSETKHLNNHIRMSASEHGAQGQYPEDWDTAKRFRVDDPEPVGAGTADNGTEQAAGGTEGAAEGSTDADPEGSTEGQTVHGLDDDPEATDPAAATLRLADSPEDSRTYECGECGTEVGYLQGECPDGHALTWQGVAA